MRTPHEKRWLLFYCFYYINIQHQQKPEHEWLCGFKSLRESHGSKPGTRFWAGSTHQCCRTGSNMNCSIRNLAQEIEVKMLAHTPIKRLGTAEDIAGAMLYFASPISEWVSGQTIFVNGGGEQTPD